MNYLFQISPKFVSTCLFIAFSSAASAQNVSCISTPSGLSYPAQTTNLRTTASISPELANFTLGGLMPCSGTSLTVGYGITLSDQYFCDSVPLPADLDPNQSIDLTINTGVNSGNGTNDWIAIDRFNGAQIGSTPFRILQSGPITPNTAYTFNLPLPFITNAQSIGNQPPNGVIDLIASDDTAIVSTQLTYCPLAVEVHSYMVKYVCGLGIDEDLRDEAKRIVAPGKYLTEINIANPHLTQANIRKDVIPLVTNGDDIFREPDQIGIQGGEDLVLNSVHATFDDCAAIGRMLGRNGLNNNKISIGYLRISSDIILDVEAVTTAGALSDTQAHRTVPALHIHHYDPKTVVAQQ